MSPTPRHQLPSTPYGVDDGSADPRIAAALAAFDRGVGGSADVLAALAGGRLLVPVVAVPTEALSSGEVGDGPTEALSSGEVGDGPAEALSSGEVGDGPAEALSSGAAEKSTQMATVLTTGRDGRRGLLAFTCVETIQRWNPDARSSPVPTRSAAEAALADGADALVIDLAGPVVFSIDARDLRSLASGWRPLGMWPGVEEADPSEHGGGHHRLASPVGRVRVTGGRVWRRVRRRLRG